MKQKLPFFVQTVVLLSFKAHSFFVFFIFASRFGYSGSPGYHGTLPHCLTAGFYHGVSQLARVRDAGGLGLQSLLGWRVRSLLNRVMCSAGQSCSQQCYVLIARYGAHARGWSPRARRARKALFLGLSKRAELPRRSCNGHARRLHETTGRCERYGSRSCESCIFLGWDLT